MKKTIGTLAAVCVVLGGLGVAGSATARAQDQGSGSATPPPPILLIHREFVKPGMVGAPHEKTESAVAQVFRQANYPTHYIGMTSLSGRDRALFVIAYDSFADMQKDVAQMAGNSSVAQQFDQADQADGKLLISHDAGVFEYQPKMSVHPNVDVARMRYFVITRLEVREGHDADWHALAKLHDSAYGNIPDAHWAMYEKEFGHDSGSIYIAIMGLRSLAELDAFHKEAGHAWSQVSAEQKKKMEDLDASTLKSVEQNVYMFDPKMSYVSQKWTKEDPSFWDGQQ